jgi:hypothetical protein
VLGVCGSLNHVSWFLSFAVLVCTSNMHLSSFVKDCYSVLKGGSQVSCDWICAIRFVEWLIPDAR